MRRVVWLVVVCAGLLLLPAAAQNDRPTVQLNGGMTAQLLSVTRDQTGNYPGISAAVKITNAGQDRVSLIFTGAPSVIDDTGVEFHGTISGVGWCRNVARQCIGFPSAYYAFPVQQYTQLDPGTSVTALFNLPAGGRANSSRSISLSAEMAYRVVSDPARDASLSNAQKLQQVTMGSVGFGPVAITDNPVNLPPAPVRQRPAPLPYRSPARSAPLSPSPSADDNAIGQGIASVVNDRNAGKIITGGRVIVAAVLLIFGFLLWTAIKAYRNTRELNCFGASAAWAALIGGIWAFEYFQNHGAFFAWPLVVVVVFFLLIAWAWFGGVQRKKKYAEWMRNDFPEPPGTGAGPADMDDFADWTDQPEEKKPANVIDFRDLLRPKNKK